MKRTTIIIFLSVLGVCLGQGGMHGGGDMTWGDMTFSDNYNELGTHSMTPMMISENVPFTSPPRVSSTTQAPIVASENVPITSTPNIVSSTSQVPHWSTGGTRAAKAGGEGEGESSVAVPKYKGERLVIENHSFTIECELERYYDLKWTHNGKRIKNGEGGYSVTSLPASPLSSRSRLSVAKAQIYHEGKYKCGTFTSFTSTPPYIVFVLSVDTSGIDSMKRMFIAYPLVLSCNMTLNENIVLHLDWYKNGTKLEDSDRLRIHQHNSSLVINMPVVDDVGTYRCDVSNETMSAKPPPKTIKVVFFDASRKMPKSGSVTDQEILEIECPVEGRPFPVITWTKDKKNFADVYNNSRAQLETNQYGVPDGKVVIHKADKSDRGNYSCTITTPLKVYEKYTFIRVKDVYAALWPFLGIVVEVLLLGIIIFIFEKRRAKAEFEESDTDQGNDQKADHNKDSVRQRNLSITGRLNPTMGGQG